MIDREGEEWLTVHDAACRLLVRQSVIYVWVSRHAVRVHRIATPGRPGKPRVYVNMIDAMGAEKAWRDRSTRRERLDLDAS